MIYKTKVGKEFIFGNFLYEHNQWYSKETGKDKASLLLLTGRVGKSILIDQILINNPDFISLRAYTDRPPRPDERKICITPDEYSRMEQEGRFMFSHSKYNNRYGNTFDTVEAVLKSNKRIIMDYPLQDIRSAQASIYMPSKVIYVLPPSIDVLQQRLSSRPERFQEALSDLSLLNNEKYIGLIIYFLMNENLEQAIQELTEKFI